MIDVPQWRGALPSFEIDKWDVCGDVTDWLSDETMVFVDWLVRTGYADISGVVMNHLSTSRSLQVAFCWNKPLDEVFHCTPPQQPEGIDRIIDRLIERGDDAFADADVETRPLRYEPTRHRSIGPGDLPSYDHNFSYHFNFWVNGLPSGVPARNAEWFARKLRIEFKKNHYECQWPQAALKAFNYWLEVDGKDVYIARPRDLEEEPLTRRIRVRKENDIQTISDSNRRSVHRRINISGKRRRLPAS